MGCLLEACRGGGPLTEVSSLLEEDCLVKIGRGDNTKTLLADGGTAVKADPREAMGLKKGGGRWEVGGVEKPPNAAIERRCADGGGGHWEGDSLDGGEARSCALVGVKSTWSARVRGGLCTIKGGDGFVGSCRIATGSIGSSLGS